MSGRYPAWINLGFGYLKSSSYADIINKDMKILQTSNIYFGRYFENNCSAGNKLRAGIKSIFSEILKTAKDEKVDLVILAGNTFDNLDLSQNLLDSIMSEIAALDNIPVALFPGNRDFYELGSFWDYWKIVPPAKNLYLLSGKKAVQQELPQLSLTIYGIPVRVGQSAANQMEYIKKSGASNYHIAVTNAIKPENAESAVRDSIDMEPFETFGFNYVAVCGTDDYREYPTTSIKAISAGSPLGLSPGAEKSPGVMLVNIEGNTVSTEMKSLPALKWKNVEILMESIHSIDDLKAKILENAGQHTLLNVKLSGLALLEAGLNIEHLKEELAENFLDLNFEDNTSVLPKNISEVKVHEKSVLGQYLKVMVGKLNEASGEEHQRYEKSLKIGYTLLSGREIW